MILLDEGENDEGEWDHSWIRGQRRRIDHQGRFSRENPENFSD